MSNELGLSPIDVNLGPWPVDDNQGTQIAIKILHASQCKGRNNSGYVQFNSVRKLIAAYVNIYQTSPLATQYNRLLTGFSLYCKFILFYFVLCMIFLELIKMSKKKFRTKLHEVVGQNTM